MGTRECNPRTGEMETRVSLRLAGQFSMLYEVGLMSSPVSETKQMVPDTQGRLLGSTWVCTCMHVPAHTCAHTQTQIKIRYTVIPRLSLSE